MTRYLSVPFDKPKVLVYLGDVRKCTSPPFHKLSEAYTAAFEARDWDLCQDWTRFDWFASMKDQDEIRLDDKNIHSLKMYRSDFDSIYIKRD